MSSTGIKRNKGDLSLYDYVREKLTNVGAKEGKDGVFSLSGKILGQYTVTILIHSKSFCVLSLDKVEDGETINMDICMNTADVNSFFGYINRMLRQDKIRRILGRL